MKVNNTTSMVPDHFYREMKQTCVAHCDTLKNGYVHFSSSLKQEGCQLCEKLHPFISEDTFTN